MNATRPNRIDRVEAFIRCVLALALLAGVAWAMTEGETVPAFGFLGLRS